MSLTPAQVPYTGPYSSTRSTHPSKGPTVRALKRALSRLGYIRWWGLLFDATWRANRSFDKAFKRWQRDRRLRVDGVYGNQAWTMLRSEKVRRGRHKGQYALDRFARDLIRDEWKAKQFSRPLASRLTSVSEFWVPDAEGARSSSGRRYHAAKDWFASANSPVLSPESGKVVEARPSSGTSGQVFGGTVKVQTNAGRVWVFRHVVPGVRVGQRVVSSQRIAAVSPWRDGPEHAHIEVWKTLAGGYRFENMVDPMTLLGRFL